MAFKTITDLQAKPGQRADLMKAMDVVLASMKSSPGFSGITRYEVIDNPDRLIEITEWESAEARQAWLEDSMSSGLLTQLISTLGSPFKAMTVREIE